MHSSITSQLLSCLQADLLSSDMEITQRPQNSVRHFPVEYNINKRKNTLISIQFLIQLLYLRLPYCSRIPLTHTHKCSVAVLDGRDTRTRSRSFLLTVRGFRAKLTFRVRGAWPSDSNRKLFSVPVQRAAPARGAIKPSPYTPPGRAAPLPPRPRPSRPSRPSPAPPRRVSNHRKASNVKFKGHLKLLASFLLNNK